MLIVIVWLSLLFLMCSNAVDGFEAMPDGDDRAVMAQDQVCIHQAPQQRDHTPTDDLGQAAPGVAIEVVRDRTTSIACDGAIGDQPGDDEVRDASVLAAGAWWLGCVLELHV